VRPLKLSSRERRKIATREALLTAAQEVIAVKGVYLAVIEEITERADVAKGSFYQYFQDRDDLLYVILNRRLQELRETLEATAAPRAFAERARMLLRHHLDYLLRHEDFLLFLHQIRGLIKMKENETSAVRDAYQRYLQFLTEWLQPQDTKARANGKAREENACAVLGFLTGFLSHYAMLASLADLTRDKARIETALTAACLGFWQR
jgi:AcrR family transcriptional regulator